MGSFQEVMIWIAIINTVVMLISAIPTLKVNSRGFTHEVPLMVVFCYIKYGWASRRHFGRWRSCHFSTPYFDQLSTHLERCLTVPIVFAEGLGITALGCIGSEYALLTVLSTFLLFSSRLWAKFGILR